MDNTEHLVDNFKDKYNKMSKRERIAFLQKYGLEFIFHTDECKGGSHENAIKQNMAENEMEM